MSTLSEKISNDGVCQWIDHVPLMLQQEVHRRVLEIRVYTEPCDLRTYVRHRIFRYTTFKEVCFPIERYGFHPAVWIGDIVFFWIP